MTTRRSLVLLVALLLLLTGCGKGAATGKGVNLKASGGANGLFPTTAPPKVKPSASVKPKPVVTHTTAPPHRPTQRPTQAPVSAPPFNIALNGDKSGKALIDPPQASVYAGTKVVWHNNDSKPHGVQAQNGAFKSGPIAPGGSYTWVAVAGMYAYQDSTRPYVNAQIQVAPR